MIDGMRSRSRRNTAVGLALVAMVATHCQKAPPTTRPPSPMSLSSHVLLPSAERAASTSDPPRPVPPTATTTASARSAEVAPEPPDAGEKALRKEPLQLGVMAWDGKLQEASRVIGRMKPSFIACRERGLAEKGAEATLRGAFRFSITVAPTGKVSRVGFPMFNRGNPDFDPNEYLIPNPTNAELNHVVVPCVKAVIEQSRFAAAASDWWIRLDVQVE